MFALVNFGLLARALTREEFGLWTFFLTIFSLFEMVRNGMVGRPLVKMGQEGDSDYFGSLVASAIKICIWITVAAAVLVFIGFTGYWLYSGDVFYLKITLWFALTAIITIPYSMGLWINSSLIKFQNVTVISGLMKFFFLLGSIAVWWYELGLEAVFWLYVLSALLASVSVVVRGFDYMKILLKYSAGFTRKIFDFGKYSLGTMLGSSALASSDTFIIMAFLGPEAVALYNVPMRIINLYNIPLRALVQITYPTLSKVRHEKGKVPFIREFEKSTGFTFLALLPLSILIFIFAEPLVVLIGGSDYAASATMLRFFSFYIAITPLDRLGGIALDVINKPNLNFKKMLIMLGINVVGDLLAIYFGGGVTYVALASIFTFGFGTMFAFYFLSHDIRYSFLRMLETGKNEVLRLFFKIIPLR